MTTRAKGERSRARLVQTTAALLQRQGYHGTGLSEIVAESGAPRGSLYFYFPGGKEELACCALEAAGAEWRTRLEQVIDAAPDLGEAVRAVCRVLADRLVESGYEHGCPLATVALEASTSSLPVRLTIAAHFDGWQAEIARRLADAGLAPAEADRMAGFALAAIEGAIMLAKVKQSPTPLLETGEVLRAMFARG